MLQSLSYFWSFIKNIFFPFTLVDKFLHYLADTASPYIVKFVNWVLSKFGTEFTVGESFNESVNFFIYDSFKIIILLSFMIFTISFIRSYFPPEKVKEMLSKFKGIWANVVASVLGVLSPF